MTAHAKTRASRAALPFWRRLGWRLGVGLVLLAALGILVSGFLQYRAQDRLLRESLGGLLLNIARTGALLVDGDLHEAVVRAGRTDTEAYAALRKQLTRIQETNNLKDAVYTLSDVDGAMARFAVISMWNVPVGEPYRLVPEIQPILRRVLAAGTPGYTDIYQNEHGTWITAFAPIRNATGKTVAALDVDFRAGVYLDQLAAVRRRLYFHSLTAAVLALVAGVVLARHITRPVAQLAALARGVVEGDLTSRVRVSARDEIGMLANVFYLMVERLQVSYRSLTAVLVRALEARSIEPGSLSRLARATLALAERLGASSAQRETLELGALLHDVGEIRTPEAILQKPGLLTAAERKVLERHPAEGVDILESVPILTPALEVVGAHHERYDGKGYPQGLRGEEIPFAARIFAVVDALDAMTHDRPHRPARPLKEALEELGRESGAHFDPRVVDMALAIPETEWMDLLGISGGVRSTDTAIRTADAA
jgi:HAMP domain-containing protein